MSPLHLTLLTLSLILSPSLTSSTWVSASYSHPKPDSKKSCEAFIRTACNTTTYPSLCCKTLLPYASKIKSNPRRLVIAALSATLSAAQSASTDVSKLCRQNNLDKYAANAVKDCFEEMKDSIDEIKESIAQMNNMGNNNNDMKFKISNVQTYMSAAITDEDTCMDEIGDGRVNPDVKKRIRGSVLGVAKLTTNALSLCNHIQY